MIMKHFKKTLIMNNTWMNTCKALKELLVILSCSKCKKSLHDPQQFLICGHFSCISCINNKNICNECQVPCGRDNIVKDSTIEKIIKACCLIANEVGFQQDSENITSRHEKKYLNEKIESIEFEVSVNNTSLNNLEKKRSLNHSPNEHLNMKKQKINKSSSDNENLEKKKNKEINQNIRVPKNINKRNYLGETPLQSACKKGNIGLVKKLLDKGADPNICCNALWTPLQESVDYNFLEITNMLLKARANPNQTGYDKRTALHEAAKNNNIDIVKLLLKYNAKKNLIDNQGNRPIDYCTKEEIKELLYCDREIKSENDQQNNAKKVNNVNENSQSNNGKIINDRNTRVNTNKNLENVINMIKNLQKNTNVNVCDSQNSITNGYCENIKDSVGQSTTVKNTIDSEEYIDIIN